jgi:hypothetical protein
LGRKEKGASRMKTIFIYNQGTEIALQYFVLEGDYSHLNGTYINYGDGKLEDELSDILDYDDVGNPKVRMLDSFPVDQVIPGTIVIEVGIIP